MAFATLPNMYITWEQSTEPLATFLRYQVYRRLVGESTWTKIRRITDRTVTFYNDFTASSDIEYEYAVTQVKDFSGEEVESEFPSPVSATLHFLSVFVHCWQFPQIYCEFEGVGLRVEAIQPKRYMAVWDRPAPVAHIGPQRSHVIETSSLGAWVEEQEVWDAIEALQHAQSELGASLIVRHQFGVRYFVTLEDPDRSHATVDSAATLSMTEVYVLEEVF